MKNNIKILTLLLFGFLIGCTDNSYDAPNTFSDVGFYTSQGQAATLQVNIYDYITFSDLSQGAVDHTWTINPAHFFLEGPISRQDSILEPFIINPGSGTSLDETINVLFYEAGLQEVNLYNTFKDSVAFRGYKDGEPYFLSSEKLGDKWVIDTTFVVKVYDTIVPEIDVKQFGVSVDYKSTDTLYVEAGDNLEFIDYTTIGEPTGRYWFVRNTLPDGTIGDETVASSSAEEAIIVFKKLGNFTAGVSVQRSGLDVPADFEQYIIPAPIKVIPSSKPFIQLGNVTELEDETIQIPFNGEFMPFLNQEQFFKVTVNGIEFPVAEVKRNADDLTVLELTLEDPIYRPDVILVSLLEGSDLQSTDTRKPVPFADAPVIMHDVNLLPYGIATIEDGGNQGKDSWKPRWNNNSGGIVEFSTDRAASGDWSMKLTMPAGAANVFADAQLESPLVLDPTKTYLLEYKVFVESSTVLPNESGLFMLPNWGFQMWKNFDYPQGEWKTQTAEYKGGTSLTILWLRILSNAAKTSDIVAYYDDFYMVEKEVRP